MEFQTCRQTETVLLKNMMNDKTPEIKVTDEATTLMARDYKGLNNFGFNGVLEWQK